MDQAGRTSGATQQEQAGGSGLLMLRTAFDYSIWGRDRLLSAIEGLDDSALRQPPAGGAYGSIFDTLVHLAASEWLWTQRCMGESPLRSPQGEDFKDLGALVDWWNDVHVDAVALLDGLTEADLGTTLTYTAPGGKVYTRKVWQMLLHVPNHQTDHRSQIATMLGQLGVEVPQMDMVVYLNEMMQTAARNT